MVNSRRTMQNKLSEWMWRFLAIVMMFSVGWTVWIIYQISPPPLTLDAAFEAAAKAKANVKGAPAEKQSAQGVIASAGAETPQAPGTAASAPAEAPKEPKEPPINPDKLKFTETLSIPAPPEKK